MNDESLVMDIRKIEKRNVLTIIAIVVSIFIFMPIAIRTKFESSIPGIGSVFSSFLLIGIFNFLPLIRLMGIVCPKCSFNFHKEIDYSWEANNEKERTQCFNCQHTPRIYSDYLKTDCLSKEFSEPLIDLRPTEEQICKVFFTAGAITVFFSLILYFINSATLQIDIETLSIFLIVLFLFGCYLIISSHYKKTICPKCNQGFFRGYFGVLRAINKIAKSKCASCDKETFIRSYLYISKQEIKRKSL